MASPGAGAERIIDNRFDRARASTAFGAAAETAVNLFWMAGKVFGSVDGVADIVVAEDVTGTNNHENEAAFRAGCGAIDIQESSARQNQKRCFQAIPNWSRAHTGMIPERLRARPHFSAFLRQ
jgi:hypothetical protein